MLQQTTVKAVAPYYARFLARWPDVRALAAAPLDEVLKTWAGLGYYARARNLHACARAVVERHGGEFPASEAALRALPGIGSYTAAAIAAIAYGLPATAVDGNVERVIARLYAVAAPLPGRQGRDFPARACPHPAAPRRRFRASRDGPRRDPVHAEEAWLRSLPLERMLRRVRARRCGDVSTPATETRTRAAPRRRFRRAQGGRLLCWCGRGRRVDCSAA